MVHGHLLLILPSSGTNIVNIPEGYHAANGKVTVSYLNGDVTVTIPEGYHDGNGKVTVYPDDYITDVYACDDGRECLLDYPCFDDGSRCIVVGASPGCVYTDRRCPIGLDVRC